MVTCFLFAKNLDEKNALSLCLDEHGQVDAPLAYRTIDEIKALQMNARTMVVLPTEVSSLHEVELSWLGEQKARAAIPYALEEQLAQEVATLHFVFDRQHYQNNRYLVGVIDKQLILNLMNKLEALNLDFNLITLDWFALRENEACGTETSLIVHEPSFKGALSDELAKTYLDNRPASVEVFTFSDSLCLPSNPAHHFLEIPSAVWIAQRLLQANPMNFCQGELQKGTTKQTSQRWYRMSIALLGVWLISLLVVKIIVLHSLNGKIATLDQQIAVIYREFFPGARQIISPKFRISQLINADRDRNHEVLWQLLAKLSDAFNINTMTIEQLRFEGQRLSVTLTSKDFSTLEQVQRDLQKAHVNVIQTQASSHAQHVVATLELRV